MLYKSKKSSCITVNSHVNSSESKKLNTSNSYNVIVNTNLPRIKVRDDSSFDTISFLKKVTYTESNVRTNYEVMDENKNSKDI